MKFQLLPENGPKIPYYTPQRPDLCPGSRFDGVLNLARKNGEIHVGSKYARNYFKMLRTIRE